MVPDASGVLMSINKRVNEAHHHDPILRLRRNIGDEVMEKMFFSAGAPLPVPIKRYTCCQHNTSNVTFSRCKSVQKMAAGKNDDQTIQPDNKLIIRTKSENLELVLIA